MMYYLGKGTEFKKEECKEYKTKDGAMKGMAKTDDGVVWDENGQFIASVVDVADIPDGALQTNPDGGVPAFDNDGNPVGTVDAATVAAVTGENDENARQDDDTDVQSENDTQESSQNDENAPQDALNSQEGTNTPSEQNEGENEANTKSVEQENKVIIPQGKMKVTVICDGSLNLRRSPSWGNDNICGRATRGQTYYVKELHVVNGKKMVRTIGDIYLSGESEHVQFEQL